MRIRTFFSKFENNWQKKHCFRHLCPSSHPYAKTERLIGGSFVKFHMRNFHWNLWTQPINFGADQTEITSTSHSDLGT